MICVLSCKQVDFNSIFYLPQYSQNIISKSNQYKKLSYFTFFSYYTFKLQGIFYTYVHLSSYQPQFKCSAATALTTPISFRKSKFINLTNQALSNLGLPHLSPDPLPSIPLPGSPSYHPFLRVAFDSQNLVYSFSTGHTTPYTRH